MNAQRKAVRAKISRCPLADEYEAITQRLMLTPRQRKILELIYKQGLTALEADERLGYSEATVNREHRAILEKAMAVLL